MPVLIKILFKVDLKIIKMCNLLGYTFKIFQNLYILFKYNYN